MVAIFVEFVGYEYELEEQKAFELYVKGSGCFVWLVSSE
jgi:hypothetical protein